MENDFLVQTRDGKHYQNVDAIKTVYRHGNIIIDHKTWVSVPNSPNQIEVDALTSIPVYLVVSLVNAMLRAVDAPEDVNVYNHDITGQNLELMERIKQLEEENSVLRMAMAQ